jgi:hypothetical protein
MLVLANKSNKVTRKNPKKDSYLHTSNKESENEIKNTRL